MAVQKFILSIKDAVDGYIERHYKTSSNIVFNADGTTVQEHIDDVLKHLTEEQSLKLFNLPENASSTFATKSELAGFQANRVVADIDERDALENILTGTVIYVKDATADTSVTLGGATYIYDGETYAKVAEWESLDLIVNWDDVQGKPVSTVTQIDDAVTKAHVHDNKAVLDTLSKDGNRLALDGVVIANLSDVQSQLIISDTEPVGQMTGGIWLKPIE